MATRESYCVSVMSAAFVLAGLPALDSSATDDAVHQAADRLSASNSSANGSVANNRETASDKRSAANKTPLKSISPSDENSPPPVSARDLCVSGTADGVLHREKKKEYTEKTSRAVHSNQPQSLPSARIEDPYIPFKARPLPVKTRSKARNTVTSSNHSNSVLSSSQEGLEAYWQADYIDQLKDCIAGLEDQIQMLEKVADSQDRMISSLQEKISILKLQIFLLE